MSDPAYAVGDRVMFVKDNPLSTIVEGPGVVTAVSPEVIDEFAPDGWLYEVTWDKDGPMAKFRKTSEGLQNLRPIPPIPSALTPDMARSIATYLALDSAEDETVALWVEALEQWAK